MHTYYSWVINRKLTSEAYSKPSTKLGQHQKYPGNPVWRKWAKEGLSLKLLRKFYSKYNSEIPYKKFLGRVFLSTGSVRPNYLSTPYCSCTTTGTAWYWLKMQPEFIPVLCWTVRLNLASPGWGCRALTRPSCCCKTQREWSLVLAT